MFGRKRKQGKRSLSNRKKTLPRRGPLAGGTGKPEADELPEIEELPELEELTDLDELAELEELTDLEELPELEEPTDLDEQPKVGLKRRNAAARRGWKRTRKITGHPLRTVWLSPVATIRGIIASDPRRLVFPLAAVAGVELALATASRLNLGDHTSLLIIGLSALLAGPLLGIGLLYLLGAILTRLGSLFGGRGRAIEVRAALAWAAAPLCVLVPLWIVRIALFGSACFASGRMLELASSQGSAPLLVVFLIAEIVCWFWAAVAAMSCISDVHRIPAGPALAALTVCIGPLLVAFILSGRLQEALFAPSAAGGYLVLVDPGPWNVAEPLQGGEYMAAAKAIARFHQGRVVRFDPGDLDQISPVLKEASPRFVVFVLPPDKIDVGLCNKILEIATRVDDDPFVDFEYGYITGRNGAAAFGFANRIIASWNYDYKRIAAQFGVISSTAEVPEEALDAVENPSSNDTAGSTLSAFYMPAKCGEDERKKRAREILADLQEKEAVLFFSHGDPEELAGAFKGEELIAWNIDLSPAVVISCACYNGATGRWYLQQGGQVYDMGMVRREKSLTLAFLDAGATAYIAGVDSWLGNLAAQVFGHILSDGMRLGEATKRMYDRLVLGCLPESLRFEDPMTVKKTDDMLGWIKNLNGSMILYGDPAFSPFEGTAEPAWFSDSEITEKGLVKVRLGFRPSAGTSMAEPDSYSMMGLSRISDFYTINQNENQAGFKLEIHKVVELPEGYSTKPDLKVVDTKCGASEVPVEELQTVLEKTASGSLLHVRIPLSAYTASLWPLNIASYGITIELSEEL